MSSARIAAPGSGFRWFKDRYQQKWNITSISKSEIVEKDILSYLKRPFKTYYVNIGPVVGQEDCQIRTLSMNERSTKTPIVLIHGLGQGMACWFPNLDAIAAERPVYAIDILGFGRSSRPVFSKGALEAEIEIVDSIEAWRKEMKLERFILLGFSFGGFLVTSYAFTYPKRLSHLIVVEPWGFPKRSSDIGFFDIRLPFKVPSGVAGCLYPVTSLFTPLMYLRLCGMLPFGHNILKKSMPVFEKFSMLGENGVKRMYDYFIHINKRPFTGEMAFSSMSSTVSGPLWAKFPMSERIATSLDKNLPLTLIYGTKSWLRKTPVAEIREMRPTSYVNELLMEVNHDCHVLDYNTFNEMVITACEFGDQNFNR